VLAKQIVDKNHFTSEQVKYMTQLFSFENNKLDLAKFAYRYTTDPKNYFVVYDALSYSSSKEQLADYIRRY
jgi:nuclear transport factor 2 (NTF2) superfamily protein